MTALLLVWTGRSSLAGGLAALAGRCGSASTRPATTLPDPAARARAALSVRPPLAELQAWRAQGSSTDFTKRSVSLGEFQDGGPPRDGIRPIDSPKAVALAAGDRCLTPREAVIAVQIAGQARAYPEQILVWPELVNDQLGGTPITVSYRPPCNSAIVFDRRVAGRTLSFGTTGKLRDSDLVMWNRQSEAWWQQFPGQALVGAATGATLRMLDSQVLSWSQVKANYPRGTVLGRDTGFERRYGTNPYVGYDTVPGAQPQLCTGRVDPRLAPLERILAVFAGASDQTAVVPFSALGRHPVIGGYTAGRPLVVLYARGPVSALDASMTDRSREIGTAAAFDPRLRGRTLRFPPRGQGNSATRRARSGISPVCAIRAAARSAATPAAPRPAVLVRACRVRARSERLLAEPGRGKAISLGRVGATR